MKLNRLAAIVAASFAAAPAAAQIPNITPFSFEVRGGLAVPMGDLKDEDQGNAESGLTVSGTVTYHALPLVGIYAGYSRSEFGFDSPLDASYTDEGLAVGARVGIPTPLIPIDPWVRAGVVRHKLSLDAEGAEEDDEAETDSDWGFEVGAGVGFAFTNKISITPGVTYTSTSHDIEGENESINVSHLRVDVGLRVRL